MSHGHSQCQSWAGCDGDRHRGSGRGSGGTSSGHRHRDGAYPGARARAGGRLNLTPPARGKCHGFGPGFILILPKGAL